MLKRYFTIFLILIINSHWLYSQITSNAPLNYCKSDSIDVTLTLKIGDGHCNFDNLYWLKNNVPIQWSDFHWSIIVHDTGTYSLFVHGVCYTCGGYTGYPMNGLWGGIIKIKYILPDTIVPNIVSDNDKLFSSVAGSGYQWYLEDALLVNSNNLSLIPVKTGYYKVVVHQKCDSIISESYYFKAHTDDVKFSEFFPNPSNGIIKLNYSLPISKLALIQVFNTMGELVYTNSLIEGKDAKEQIDLSNFPTGFYYYNIVVSNNLFQEKNEVFKSGEIIITHD